MVAFVLGLLLLAFTIWACVNAALLHYEHRSVCLLLAVVGVWALCRIAYVTGLHIVLPFLRWMVMA